MIGQTISHYEIVEKLGGGGMGVVYKARDLKLGRFVALKFLPHEIGAEEEYKRRFIHEAKAASALDHNNICTIHEIDETGDGQLFIAMAYYPGETLKKQIQRGPLPLNEALNFAIQIAQGLAKAHQKDIVHRDIKPANVMVTEDGVAKIVDFGLAQLGDATKLTKTGSTLGTPAYMSPEQVQRQPLDRRTDIWSLGAVIYEMVTGQVPFPGAMEAVVAYAISHEEPEPLTGLRSGLPIDLDRVVSKALVKSRDERYQHIDELLVDLRAVRKQVEWGKRPRSQEPPPRVEISIGQMLRHYRLEAKLGEGGMGVVYRALDTHLDRPVAIKVLRSQAVANEERKKRFVREAKAASALNHPNIVTIHDIDEADGVNYIAMEYVDGKTLDQAIGPEGLAVPEALRYAVPLADALAKAHAAGIVHRDIKPANIMVTADDLVKVLDFGLAKLTETARKKAVTDLQVHEAVETKEGRVLGTVAYMSPEQAEGKPVDARSDIFSFGTVLYEMLAGHRPFQGDSELSTLMAILRDSPAPVKKVRPDLPRELDRILGRCLEKKCESRYPSATELSRDLEVCQTRLTTAQVGPRIMLRRPRFVLAGLLVVLLVVAAMSWFWLRSLGERWARNEALPEIARLAGEGQNVAAFRLARQAEPHLAGDPVFARLWDDIAIDVSVESTPPGADVEVREYVASEDEWMYLGKTPLGNVTIPRTFLRWRVSKPGLATAYAARPTGRTNLSFVLEAETIVPEGMVRVPSGTLGNAALAGFGSLGPAPIQQYFIDRFEVTNKDYKEFVNGGGYEKREYWKHEFVGDGRVLSWDEAMGEFRDATGRPGPSTWEAGRYPEGRDNFPVAGVSWYEAAAYAEFAGKSLPTVYHWFWAAGLWAIQYIVPLSNFGHDGPAAVGSYQGTGPYGTYDMAGNVKEWCWNETNGRRFILGGAWNEATYSFGNVDARSPFDRAATNSFRCVKYPAAISEHLTTPRPLLFRDYNKEQPASEDLFRVYARQYAYDRTELEAVVESVGEDQEYWKKEKITFDAAYGDERVIAYLFLPKSVSPPYQTVVYFPGTGVLNAASSEVLVGLARVDYIIKSGRALLYPIYQGTYERRPKSWEPAMGTSAGKSLIHRRDRIIMWYKDLARSVDYLETRDDIDSGKLAYFGLSMGAANAPILCALEQRFKACILQVGGMYLRETLPEVDQLHFAPRMKAPTLMLNGRYDFIFPLEISQLPLLRLLGAPQEDKRHVIFDTAHDLGSQRTKVAREVLDWLDTYVGPVK